jgi:hypothetical protein
MAGFSRKGSCRGEGKWEAGDSQKSTDEEWRIWGKVIAGRE